MVTPIAQWDQRRLKTGGEGWRGREEIYVATDLEFFTAPVLPELGRSGYGRAVRSDGKAFRRLDDEFTAYLAGQMRKAETLAERGAISAADLGELRRRWELVTAAGRVAVPV